MYNKYQFISMLCGIIVLIFSGIVMLGWLFDIPKLIYIIHSTTPLFFNTALCLFLAAVSMTFAPYRKKLSSIIGFLITLLVSISLAQYLFNIDLHIDNFFVKSGRPAPNSLICLLLIGFTLIIANIQSKILFHFKLISTLLLFSLSMVALCGYIFRLSTAYTWGGLASMSLPASILLMLCSVGLTLNIFSIHNKKIIEFAPIRILIIGTLISILMWMAVENNEMAKIKNIMSYKNQFIQSKYNDLFDNYFNALNRFSDRVSKINKSPNAFLLHDALNYAKDYEALEGIYYIDNGKNLALVKKQSLSNQVIKDCESQKTIFNNYFTLINSEYICYVNKNINPLFTIIAIINMKKIAAIIGNASYNNNINAIIMNQKNEMIYSNTHDKVDKKFINTLEFNYKNNIFKSIIWPNSQLIASFTNIFIYIVFCMGIIFSFILAILAWLWKRNLAIMSIIEMNEKRLNLLIDGTKEYAIIFLDVNGNITTWNSGAEKLTGYQKNEILGKHYSIFHIKNQHRNEEKNYELNQALKNHIFKEENWRIKKDGSKFWGDSTISPLYDKQHNLVGYSKILKDLTERKKYEDQIKNANQKLRIIMNNSPVAIIATNKSGIIKFFNPAAEKMLGYTSDELINKATPEVFHDSKEVEIRANELSSQLNKSITPGFDCFRIPLENSLLEQKEWTYISKEGKHIPVILTTTSLIDENNILTGYLGIAVDITDQKALENYRNEFISIITHELRTPITAIHGSLDLALSQKIPIDETHEILTIASRNCERLIRLVNEVLDIHKIDAGQMKFNFTSIDVDTLLEECIKLNESYANKFNVSLQLGKNPHHLKIKGDNDRLIQVVTNLISNAVKFTHAGDSVLIDANRTTNDTVRITVTDHGPGIPQDFQSQIFQRFSQGSSGKKMLGTGLGLNISKSIIENHKGRIGFITEENKGTTFYFDLPIEKELASLNK